MYENVSTRGSQAVVIGVLTLAAAQGEHLLLRPYDSFKLVVKQGPSASNGQVTSTLHTLYLWVRGQWVANGVHIYSVDMAIRSRGARRSLGSLRDVEGAYRLHRFLSAKSDTNDYSAVRRVQ